MRAIVILILGLVLILAAGTAENRYGHRALANSGRPMKLGTVKQELIKIGGDRLPDVRKFFLCDTVFMWGYSLLIVSLGTVAIRTSPRIAIAATVVGLFGAAVDLVGDIYCLASIPLPSGLALVHGLTLAKLALLAASGLLFAWIWIKPIAGSRTRLSVWEYQQSGDR